MRTLLLIVAVFALVVAFAALPATGAPNATTEDVAFSSNGPPAQAEIGPIARAPDTKAGKMPAVSPNRQSRGGPNSTVTQALFQGADLREDQATIRTMRATARAGCLHGQPATGASHARAPDPAMAVDDSKMTKIEHAQNALIFKPGHFASAGDKGSTFKTSKHPGMGIADLKAATEHGRGLSQHERYLLSGRTTMPTAVKSDAGRELTSTGEHVAMMRGRDEEGLTAVIARTRF